MYVFYCLFAWHPKARTVRRNARSLWLEPSAEAAHG
jgi:hypothetical protein